MIDVKNENMCTSTKLEAYSAVCLLFLRSTCSNLTAPIPQFAATSSVINYTINLLFQF